MIRKTMLLTGVGALLLATPAFAQDTLATTPGATVETTVAAQAEASAETAAPQSLTLQPGSTVMGSDGVELGKLEGARANANGEQELTVRGTDGQLRAVPLAGLMQHGADVMVGWTGAEFSAAAAISADVTAVAPAATPVASAAPDAAEAAPPTLPTDPADAPTTPSEDDVTPTEPES